MSLVINCYFSLAHSPLKIWERANAILTWIKVGQSLEHDIVVPPAIKELLYSLGKYLIVVETRVLFWYGISNICESTKFDMLLFITVWKKTKSNKNYHKNILYSYFYYCYQYLSTASKIHIHSWISYSS